MAVDAFLRAERESRAPLTLVLIGRGRISLGENVHVRQLGDLSGDGEGAGDRGRARGPRARRDGRPSPPRPFQAWSLGRPVIAHGAGQVMRGLVARANGGVSCATDEELAAALEVLAAEPAPRRRAGPPGPRATWRRTTPGPWSSRNGRALLARVAASGAAAA